MERMSHADQHREYPPGTVVIAANGEVLGTIRAVYPHFLLVAQDDTDHADLEIPPHALGSYDGTRLQLTVNRQALSVVDDAETVARRSHDENA